ncbi:hypothetical protein NDU88_005715 [Pleurodeles waltl]|uniref:Uncharacterized protein n=1 Tax=Pleurodeles waltl TaxID=8319 RepID=A0AAV7NN88_PLEWA|nr:hypothetical protein NDU88_005715 [Pleurodeles waltl]
MRCRNSPCLQQRMRANASMATGQGTAPSGKPCNAARSTHHNARGAQVQLPPPPPQYSYQQEVFGADYLVPAGPTFMSELNTMELVELPAECSLRSKEPSRQLHSQSSSTFPVEQRVSDLEDAENRIESTTSQIQSELEDLLLKLDEAENRSWRSNLRFVGVPKGIEAASLVTNIISELIYKVVLSDRERTGGDLTIMRAHRVPFTRPLL